MKYKLIAIAVIAAILGTMLVPVTASVAAGANLLKNVKVTGSLPNGGSFEGKVTITKMDYDEVKGLVVSGELKGQAITADGDKQQIRQTFENVEATLRSDQSSAFSGLGNDFVASAQAQAQCQILFLDIGPIFLDVLGLQVDLSEIILDITAVGGAGNLLGNLLCAVAGLLDPGSGLLNLLEDLLDLVDLLGQINDLLG